MSLGATVLKHAVKHICFHLDFTLAIKEAEAQQRIDIDVTVITFEDIRLD